MVTQLGQLAKWQMLSHLMTTHCFPQILTITLTTPTFLAYNFLLLPSKKLPEILILSHILPWSYSSLIMLHLDDWNFCLKYSKNSPAHLSTRGLECFGQNPRIFQEMDDIIPLSVSCAALPIVPIFTALCWFTLLSTHLTPTWADARSYDSLDQILLFSSI